MSGRWTIEVRNDRLPESLTMKSIASIIEVLIFCPPFTATQPTGAPPSSTRTESPEKGDDFESPDSMAEILRLLRSNLTDDEFALALGRCSIIGVSQNRVESAGLILCQMDGYGPCFTNVRYSCKGGRREIWIEYYPDSKVCGVAGVQRESEVSWPKTDNDDNRRQRARSVLWPFALGSNVETRDYQFAVRNLWLEQRDPTFLKAVRIVPSPSANMVPTFLVIPSSR
jgi:hypothetical protein